jgi:acyl carrier protein
MEVTQAISDYIAKEILKQPRRVFSEDTRLISSGLIDSFSLVDLALFVEDTFGVKIEDTELNAKTFDTIGELVALIKARGNHHQE